MKVQGQKYILIKLVLLLSNIKHCWPFYNSLNPVTMPLIKSLSFLLTQQHTSNKFFSSFSSWILGSGATDHICSSLTHFTSYHQINHISVKLPNGNQVIANYSGNVFINQDHVLDNVLYILNFTFNLF